ncbi:MAG: TlpA family protein disulfide reductase, partial [Myxococcales bacterium]|nr:TlpA family protein disulfide reductase [Myxococcales bacterium]
ERGSPAPDFSLPVLDADTSLGLAELRGRVVLVNFWATWCAPCRDEMPAMERLYRIHGGDDFEMLAISVGEEPELVEAFQQELALTFPILLDRDKRVAEAYQTYRFPETFLVGRDGRVVERYVGPREWDHEAYVERVGRLIADGELR